jgi:hypothetical protein
MTSIADFIPSFKLYFPEYRIRVSEPVLPKLIGNVINETLVHSIEVQGKEFSLTKMHPYIIPRAHNVWIATSAAIARPAVIKTYNHHIEKTLRNKIIDTDAEGYKIIRQLFQSKPVAQVDVATLFNDPKTDGCVVQELVANPTKNYWKKWKDTTRMTRSSCKLLRVAAKFFAVAYETQKKSKCEKIVSSFHPKNMLLKCSENTFKLVIVNWKMSKKEELERDFAKSINAWTNYNSTVGSFFEKELKKHLEEESFTTLKAAIDKDIKKSQPVLVAIQ